ncbi:Microtubule-actin cross-linking factor 1, isoforms 1/2/3/5 [Cichlidogyrus casuarinus]|uniref:Microtubule-actin cross-linking factor 1, isoforms 1/2/3/5 n=1 Tax=Cichlidogyrus casuarinus TaxID=1844966 RepID=A0ABD2PWD7_9PLAT
MPSLLFCAVREADKIRQQMTSVGSMYDQLRLKSYGRLVSLENAMPLAEKLACSRNLLRLQVERLSEEVRDLGQPNPMDMVRLEQAINSEAEEVSHEISNLWGKLQLLLPANCMWSQQLLPSSTCEPNCAVEQELQDYYDLKNTFNNLTQQHRSRKESLNALKNELEEQNSWLNTVLKRVDTSTSVVPASLEEMQSSPNHFYLASLPLSPQLLTKISDHFQQLKQTAGDRDRSIDRICTGLDDRLPKAMALASQFEEVMSELDSKLMDIELGVKGSPAGEQGDLSNQYQRVKELDESLSEMRLSLERSRQLVNSLIPVLAESESAKAQTQLSQMRKRFDNLRKRISSQLSDIQNDISQNDTLVRTRRREKSDRIHHLAIKSGPLSVYLYDDAPWPIRASECSFSFSSENELSQTSSVIFSEDDEPLCLDEFPLFALPKQIECSDFCLGWLSDFDTLLRSQMEDKLEMVENLLTRTREQASELGVLGDATDSQLRLGTLSEDCKMEQLAEYDSCIKEWIESLEHQLPTLDQFAEEISNFLTNSSQGIANISLLQGALRSRWEDIKSAHNKAREHFWPLIDTIQRDLDDEKEALYQISIGNLPPTLSGKSDISNYLQCLDDQKARMGEIDKQIQSADQVGQSIVGLLSAGDGLLMKEQMDQNLSDKRKQLEEIHRQSDQLKQALRAQKNATKDLMAKLDTFGTWLATKESDFLRLAPVSNEKNLLKQQVAEMDDWISEVMEAKESELSDLLSMGNKLQTGSDFGECSLPLDENCQANLDNLTRRYDNLINDAHLRRSRAQSNLLNLGEYSIALDTFNAWIDRMLKNIRSIKPFIGDAPKLEAQLVKMRVSSTC